jgi:large subunit ribosomal protein L24e
MVKKHTCSFCGTDIEPGAGTLYVKNDGSLLYLCSSKCRKSALYLKRRARKLKWTELYEERLRRRFQASKTKAKETAEVKPKAKGKPEAKPEGKGKPEVKPEAKPKGKPEGKK